jgi:hypothetical protein
VPGGGPPYAPKHEAVAATAAVAMPATSTARATFGTDASGPRATTAPQNGQTLSRT